MNTLIVQLLAPILIVMQLWICCARGVGIWVYLGPCTVHTDQDCHTCGSCHMHAHAASSTPEHTPKDERQTGSSLNQLDANRDCCLLRVPPPFEAPMTLSQPAVIQLLSEVLHVPWVSNVGACLSDVQVRFKRDLLSDPPRGPGVVLTSLRTTHLLI